MTARHEEAAKELLRQVREVRENGGEPPTWVLEARDPERATDVWVAEMIARAQVHAQLSMVEALDKVHTELVGILDVVPAGAWPRIESKAPASAIEHQTPRERS